jgi:NAD(P)-dependent dehydrogenase (short-subunit alcohol dehydrogenase family)
VIVTGANVGLGKAAAATFVRLNAAKVILGCRSVEKGQKAAADIESAEGKKGVTEVWGVDLGSYESVKEFCRKANELPRLDVFIANAGLFAFTYDVYEGYERQVTVNVISTYLMAILLLPVMRRTIENFQSLPHQVIVSSNGHLYTKFPEQDNESIFETFRGDYEMPRRYQDTKLISVFVGRELAKRLKDGGKPLVVMNLVDPGYCQSDLLRDKGVYKSIRYTFRLTDKLLARTADMGARTYIMAAVAGEESHGLYLEDCKHSTPNPLVESEKGKQIQTKIWDELVEILERIEPGICGNI